MTDQADLNIAYAEVEIDKDLTQVGKSLVAQVARKEVDLLAAVKKAIPNAVSVEVMWETPATAKLRIGLGAEPVFVANA